MPLDISRKQVDLMLHNMQDKIINRLNEIPLRHDQRRHVLDGITEQKDILEEQIYGILKNADDQFDELDGELLESVNQRDELEEEVKELKEETEELGQQLHYWRPPAHRRTEP